MPQRRPITEEHDPSDRDHYLGAVNVEVIGKGWLGWLPGPGLRLLHVAADAEHANVPYRPLLADTTSVNLHSPALPPDDIAERTADLAGVWGQAAADHGLPLDTVDDLIGVFESIGAFDIDAYGYVQVVNPLPLVEDALPLDPDEAEREAHRRWQDLHEPTAQTILRRFVQVRDESDGAVGWDVSDGQLSWHTTLTAAGSRLGLDVDDVRHGIAVLLDGGDFIVDVDDIETVTADTAFTLTVDWQRFSESRIHLTFGPQSD